MILSVGEVVDLGLDLGNPEQNLPPAEVIISAIEINELYIFCNRSAN